MKSKVTPIIVAIMIPLVSVAAALVLIYFKKQSASTLETFPYAEYISAPKNLSGNSYSLKAELEMQLSAIDGAHRGRVVKIRDENGSKLAVFIPTSLDVNAQTKQRYEMTVLVDSDGAVIVKDMRKY